MSLLLPLPLGSLHKLTCCCCSCCCSISPATPSSVRSSDSPPITAAAAAASVAKEAAGYVAAAAVAAAAAAAASAGNTGAAEAAAALPTAALAGLFGACSWQEKDVAMFSVGLPRACRGAVQCGPAEGLPRNHSHSQIVTYAPHTTQRTSVNRTGQLPNSNLAAFDKSQQAHARF